ncbi:MAG: hypothetical protein O7C60_01630, partial [Rickettsia endosymbiont of Ixodes persulcatus]|nr:hypothetical protein [Rickettsia endosymbiont of Ixodes persulcatus]
IYLSFEIFFKTPLLNKEHDYAYSIPIRASYIHDKSLKRLYPKQCYYYTTVATSPNKGVENSSSEDAAPFGENYTQISASTLNP